MIKKIYNNIQEVKEVILNEKYTMTFKNLTHEQVLNDIILMMQYAENKAYAVDKNNNFYPTRIEGELIEIGGQVLELKELNFEEENNKEEVAEASSESTTSKTEEKNNNDLKENEKMANDVYNIVAQYHVKDGEINIGDIIYGTTSELEFNSKTGEFEKCNRCIECKVREISRDFSNFYGSRCRTGGCYGFYEFEVLEVLE